MISGRSLARNAILNFLGHGWLLVLGVISAPILLHRLGTDAYGVLAIAAIVTGYFGVLELGIGRAAVKFLSERLASGAIEDAGRLASTAVGAQILLGLLGAVLVWVSTPVLAERVLRMPPDLGIQAQFALRIMALGLPFLLVGGALEGVLMALQRFDNLTIVRIATGSLKACLAVLLVIAGFGVRGAVIAIIAVQAVHVAVVWLIVARLLPPRTAAFGFDPTELRTLMRFGGWVTVSSLIGPILVYLDRFLVGVLVSVGAVSYYSIPYDAVTKLLIIPLAIAPVLFPAFASLHVGTRDHERLMELYLRSLKYVFLIMAPLVIIVVAYARDLLLVWLGEELANRSSLVLQILAIGVFINSLAQMPFGMVQASGKPDLTAKFHLAELPVYVALCFWLIPKWGIAGAAAAWSLRVLLDGMLLATSAARIVEVSVRSTLQRTLARSIVLTGALASGTYIIRKTPTGAGVEIFLMLLALGLYMIGAWWYAMRPFERTPLTALIMRFRELDRAPT